MKDVISVRDFSKEDLESLLGEAALLQRHGTTYDMNQAVIASLFFEESTRTRTSFEVAAMKLGYQIHGFAGVEGTSVKKGEPFLDTVHMYSIYGCQLAIIRHPLEGAARFAADVFEMPIINAGDGANGHPTQAMLDLMTIQNASKEVEGLKIALVGDLKYGRTVHSLIQALRHYNVEVLFLSPDNLSLPEWRVQEYNRATKKRQDNMMVRDLEQALQTVDVLYMTRIQRERFPEGPEGDAEFRKVSGMFRLTAELVEKANNHNLTIMHPLPRDKHCLEITFEVDNLPQARYFDQVRNGLDLRQALFYRLAGEGFTGITKEKQSSHWEDLPLRSTSKERSGPELYTITNGTVIDHIEVGKGSMVLKVLGLAQYHQTPVIYMQNVHSTRHGTKEVIGIHQRELSWDELNKLALVTKATVNIVQNSRVVKKGTVILPAAIENLLECQNQRCISRPEHHEYAPSKFQVEEQEPLRVRCHYCEQPAGREELRFS